MLRNRKSIALDLKDPQAVALSQTAGHDIGYISLTDVLNAIERAGEPPSIPLNLVGDYAGGSLYLALGILSALLETRVSGQGQVIDAAIVDGTASLATTFFGMHAAGMLHKQGGMNINDSGAPFYEVYECAYGKWLSVGPMEEKFYSLPAKPSSIWMELCNRRLRRASAGPSRGRRDLQRQ